MAIDYEFIGDLECNHLIGYVPDPLGSNSGVTIASGFDIGQRSSEEVIRLIPGRLGEFLCFYAEVKGSDAVDLLSSFPLGVNSHQASEINSCVKKEAEDRLRRLWRLYNYPQDFDALSSECQTVIASVAFQYGDLSRKTPNFWGQVSIGDWVAALDNLRDFGDRYNTRRNMEADLLESYLLDDSR